MGDGVIRAGDRVLEFRQVSLHLLTNFEIQKYCQNKPKLTK